MSVDPYKLNIVTQNIRTLGHGTSGIWTRKLVKDHFQHINHSIDIILLQEHHLLAEACLDKTSQLNFLEGPSFWNEARILPTSNKTKGGTAILTSRHLAPLIGDSGIIVPGRAQFITLNMSPSETIGIINVYGYSDSSKRATLWEAINEAPLPPAQWILAGDFNMIESLDDKLGGAEKSKMYIPESEAWNRTILKFNLGDSFHMPEFRRLTKKRYTWDNGQIAQHRVATRIDRIYLPPKLQAMGGQMGILATLHRISDHAPFVLKLSKAPPKTPRSQPFNNSMLTDTEGRQLLIDAWHQGMLQSPEADWGKKLRNALRSVKAASDAFSYRKKKAWQNTYDQEINEILEAEIALQEDWGNETARKALSAAQTKIQNVRQQRLEKRTNRASAQWTRVGDRC
ncbi:hypothetical protein KC19_12G027100, partial [Ceratodon purpureus]